jgi:hypothetical protein
MEDKTHTQYIVKDNIIDFDNNCIVFDYPIDAKNVIRIDDILVIRLEVPIGIKFNKNVYGVNLIERKVIWQIEEKLFKNSDTQDCPCIEIFMLNNNFIRLNFWCSNYWIINPINGSIIFEGQYR